MPSPTRLRRFTPTAFALAAVALVAASCSSTPKEDAGTAAAADTIATAEHGAYLATVMGCHDCHTPGSLYGQPDFQRALSGSELGWVGPWGVSYPANLTPDPITGIGAWSEGDIIRALQSGKRPDGSDIRPPMPWPDFAHLKPKDVRSIALYLKSLVPVTHQMPPRLGPGEKASGSLIFLPPPSAWDAPRERAEASKP